MAEAIPPTSPTPVNELLGTAGAPSDLLGGSTIVVGGNPGDLQAALLHPSTGALTGGGAHRMNTYTCPAGAVYTAIQLPTPTVAGGWTCIRSASGSLPARGTRVSPSNAGTMFKIQSPGAAQAPSSLALSTETQGTVGGWRFIGMEVEHPDDSDQTGLIFIDTPRVLIERSYIHGRPTASVNLRRCMRAFRGDFQCWDSYLYAHEVGSDSQTIYINTFGSGSIFERFHVENCELQAAGENILVNDQDAATVAFDVTFKRNHFFKPLAWHQFLSTGGPNPAWDGVTVTVKNLCELKWVNRFLAEGNIFENMWAGAQDGTAILIYSGVSTDRFQQTTDVMFRNNELIQVGHAFTSSFGTGGGGSVGARAARVAILNNRIKQNTGKLILANWGTDDLWVEHNTSVPTTGTGINVYIQVVGVNSAFPRMTLRRNAFGRGATAVQGADFVLQVEQEVDATWANNQFHVPDRDWRENAVYGGATGTPGFTGYASASAAGINDTTAVLTSTSPLKVGQVGYVGTDGKDIGVDHVAVDNAIAGVVIPAVPVANFTQTQTVGTFTMQFTDLSSNTPTAWSWSGPDGFTSTSQNPSFTFPTAGTKSITLVASNALGSSAPYVAQITVAALPGFTHVQTTIGTHGTTLRVQVPTLTVGNLVMVHVVSAQGSTPVTITGMADAAGNTYTPVNAGGTLIGAQTWVSRSFYTVVTSGSGSPVVLNATLTGTNPQTRLIASEYQPLLGAITFVGSPSPMQAGGGVSPMDSGPLATPATGGALLLGFTDYDAAVVTTPAGWTNRGPSNTVAEKLDPTVSTTYRFQPTYTGTQNWIAQIAIFASGVSGGPPPDTTAPTVPSGLTHDTPVATDRVRLTWPPSFDSVGVVNYDVRRDGVVVGTVTTPDFTDTGLQSNTAYSYTVRANDAVPNASAYSAAHVVTTGIIETGTFLPPRFMRGFGPVRGAGATDAIQTPLLGHGVQRTITGVLRIDSAGAAQVLFTKASNTITSLTERFRAPGNSTLLFERQWSNALGAWSIPIPSLGVRHFFVIRLDTSAPANLPTIKIDNLQQVLTTVSQPTNGTATQNTAGYMLGNQPGGAAVLNGDLGRFAVFNFITTDQQDAALFAANDPAGIGAGAVQYLKLDGTAASEPDQVTAAPSVLTGTVVQDYEPPSFVTVVSAGRRMVGWVR